MSDEIIDDQDESLENIEDENIESGADEHAPMWDSELVKHSVLHGMYRLWFLDYASYVILERAVPHLDDGLKPVQRRVLHAMNRLEDGRFNKVANIIGATMKFHPHGDASIGDALVGLGQKELLIETQGNWGNILTGDEAAAPRYIEARLSKFALDVAFSPKVTQFKMSYDGRDEEPVTLPVKYPLLLAQGVEGIAVGLASKILPHNFNELIDASILYLKNEPFELYPDFPTGGTIDVSKYNDGVRGGVVRVRAKIEKRDAKTLAITEIPFSKTTSSIIDSILKVNDKKIKIKKIDDNTAASAEIILQLPAGTSPDKTIDALYAFTDCELSISPNSCVIYENKPHFMGVSEILRRNTDRTVGILQQELQIHLNELEQQWHMLSLEKIFIEERIYKDKEYEQAPNIDAACEHIDERLTPYYPMFVRAVTKDDIMHLFEIKMGRILKFNSQAVDEKLIALKEEMEQVRYNIEHIIDFTIDYFRRIKKQYGKGRERKTEIRSFDNIEATKVVVKNEKLYLNREDGFMGYGLKKGDYIADCSDIDDAIIFYEDGRYVIKKIEDKVNVGMGVIHIAVFKKNDTRTIYNAVYLDGESGISYVKRFSVTGITHDREYNVTMGTPKSKILYFSANPNGEGELLKVLLKPKLKLRNVVFDYDMSNLMVKGRASRGNVLTKNEVHKVVLKRKGGSTLGGRQVWFEPETLRLNADGRGNFLGEFNSDDYILVIKSNGEIETSPFKFELHFDDNFIRIEKFDDTKVWTAVYWDGEQKYYYIKRFRIEAANKPQLFISEADKSRLVLVSDEDHARIQITYGGADKWRNKEEIDAFDFIGEKGIKAKGKRVTTYEVQKFVELEPLIPSVRNQPQPENEADETAADDDNDEPVQQSLFD
ncbi:MAG: DNA gyrase/topoisomerase IV subunit A [Bacteroidales bacterium]|nr:DNA gyrase/topoisomerase IV subunit A [Bacteroidales bacterium]